MCKNPIKRYKRYITAKKISEFKYPLKGNEPLKMLVFMLNLQLKVQPAAAVLPMEQKM